MKKTRVNKFLPLILAAAFFLCSVFCCKAYAKVVLIDEERDKILHILANSDCLSGKPVLFFTKQMQESASLCEEDYFFLAGHINKFVLTDSNFFDLSVDFATEQIIELQESEDVINFQISISKAGKYQIYLDKKDLRNKFFSFFEISLNGQKLPGFDGEWPQNLGKKYTLIGETEFARGKQKVSISLGRQDEPSADKGGYRLLIVKKAAKSKMEQILKKKLRENQTQFLYVMKNSTGEFFIYDALKTQAPLNFRLQVNLVKNEIKDVLKSGNLKKPEKLVKTTGLIKIDQITYSADEFKKCADFSDESGGILVKEIFLSPGAHSYQRLDNEAFVVSWAMFEELVDSKTGIAEPDIVFKRINPAKYLIDVKNAACPFWLVFSETFHKKWVLFKTDAEPDAAGINKEIERVYPGLNVSEAKHQTKFLMEDMNYIKLPPVNARHFNVNSYSNAWYIDPQNLKLGENFSLVLYFLPQSYFYLGLALSAGVCCLAALLLVMVFTKHKILRYRSRKKR